MSNDALRELIEQILEEKKQQIIARINAFKKTVVNQLDDLTDLGEFSMVQIPEGFDTLSSASSDEKIDILHATVTDLAKAENQGTLINALLEGIGHFCSRAALFLIRDDKMVGWSGRGFSRKKDGARDEDIKKIFISISADTIFKHTLTKKKIYTGPPKSQSDDHLIYSRFGGEDPEKILVFPFFVKGKPQAVIYADGSGEQPVCEKEIEIISIVGEMSLDLLPLKQKIMARVQTKEYVEEPEETVVSKAADADEVTTTAKPHLHEETAASIRENDPERKARVIINDIILYNKGVVDRGIQKGNLYQVLEDTILQAKEEYLRKFSDLSAFERNLITILAQGDRDLLKGYKFETL